MRSEVDHHIRPKRPTEKEDQRSGWSTILQSPPALEKAVKEGPLSE